MITIYADRERVVVNENGDRRRRFIVSKQGEAPYARPFRLRTKTSVGSVLVTLRWSDAGQGVGVSVRRWLTGRELLSTEVRPGGDLGSVSIEIHGGQMRGRVTRVRGS